MGKRKKKSRSKILNLVIAIIIIILGALSVPQIQENAYIPTSKNTQNISNNVDTNLKVYFIDVGQADSILIQNDGKNMLIDAGNNNDGSKLVKYFQDLGITKFDILVGTHPHEDHIGGLDDIIKSFDIETIYMPKVSTTTATFEEVLDAIESKKLLVTTPIIGNYFNLGECNFTILSTGTNTENLNSTSILLKMTFGEKSFIFTGDAITENETAMLDKDISADVLKVGHHGSDTSTSQEFLNKVNPQYAVISVGKENSYGHPKLVTLEKLSNKNITVYRTDELGTIIMSCDGKEISVETIKTDTNGDK